ncbi:MAG: hypothetical protein AAGH89_05780 [Verrucomicrobiota bacterium]
MMTISLSNLAKCAILIAPLALLCSCFRSNASQDHIDRLSKRLLDMEEELDALRATAASPDRDRLASLEQRVIDTEKSQGQIRDAVVQELRVQNEKLQRTFRGFNQMQDVIQTGQTWAAFGLEYEGHAVARTKHGSFLIELVEQEATQNGYRLTLRIGNPSGLLVHQFRIYGDYGSPPPNNSEITDYESYIRNFDQWEGSLKKFEANFVTSLAPDDWTLIGLVIPAERLAELRFIRFKMEIDRASLVNRATKEEAYTQMSISQKGATMLNTPYGSFPITIAGHTKTLSGHELELMIGNPLGMTVTSARLKGRLGPKPPKIQEQQDYESFSMDLAKWDRELTPFEARIPMSLIPFHWNRVKIRVPAVAEEDLEHIRAQLEILNVSLRNKD